MGSIIYFIIGFIVCNYIWNKYYAKGYKEAKAKGEVEEGAAVILLLILTVFWPIWFVLEIIKFVKNKWKKKTK